MGVLASKPFSHDKQTLESLKLGDDGAQRKHAAMNKFKAAMNYAGSLEHQADLILTYSTSTEPAIGRTLGMVRDPVEHWSVASDLKANAANFFGMMNSKKSNDAIGARNTVLLALCGPAPLDTAPKDELKEHKKRLKAMARQLNLTPAMTQKAIEMSQLRRNMFTRPDIGA